MYCIPRKIGGLGDWMRAKVESIFLVFLLLTTTCLILFTLPITAEEDEYKFGVNIRINDDIGTTVQVEPDIEVASNGVIGVVWLDGRVSGGNNDIFFSSSTDGGHMFGDDNDDTDIMVNDDTTSASQLSPAVASYNNEFYVVWVDARIGGWHIYFSKSTEGGSDFSSNKMVDNSATDAILRNPDIAVSTTGVISVVWQKNIDGKYKIFYSESSNGGSTFSESIRVDDTGTGANDLKYPKIAIGSEGDKYVAWQDDRDGDSNIYSAHAAAGVSSAFGTNIRVDNALSGDQIRPTIGAFGSSNVYVAWCDKRSDSKGDIYFAKSTDKGSNFGTDKRVDDTTSSSTQEFPDLTVDSSGNINIVWLDKRATYPKIYYANSTDGGSTINTNLRVDDTGTTNVDKTRPKIVSYGPKRFYIVWQDKREGNDDIYFSRWGKASEMVGYAPELTSLGIRNPTTGDQIDIGGVQDTYRFKVSYLDVENDACDVAEGFPKLYVYIDETKTTEFPGSPFSMNPENTQDIDYSDGKVYYKDVNLNEEHDYHYMFEAKAETGNETLVQSEYQSGLRVDDTLPTFKNPTPEPGNWYNSVPLNCTILISDQGGVGVDSLSISYRLLKNDSAEYTRWYTNIERTKIGSDYKCTASVSFSEGAENYIQWNATDIIGKKYGLFNTSNLYEIKLDTTPVTFTNPEPVEEYYINTKTVTCTLTISDLSGSGVNASSIGYYYRTATDAYWSGPYFAQSFMENGEILTVSTPEQINFANGINHIKWQALDLAGNFVISKEFEIKIDDSRPSNIPPEAPKAANPDNSKNPNPFIEWEAGFDADGDKLNYYIQIGTTEYGDDTLKWTYTGSNRYYRVNKTLIIGTYYVQIKAYDGLDNSSIFLHVMNITSTGGDPPAAPEAIYPDVTSEHKPKIYWTMPISVDGSKYNYLIRIGTSSNGEEILTWTIVGMGILEYTLLNQLNDGIYYVQLMSKNENGTSYPYEETLKIATFDPQLEVDTVLIGKQGELTSIDIILKNNCIVEDRITINLTGELVTKPSVTISTAPTSPILLQPGENKTVKILIQLPSQINTGKYALDIQAVSEDGKTKSLTHTLVLTVERPDNGPSDGGEDGDGEASDVGGIMDYLWIIILIIIIIVVIGAVAAASSKKKREAKEKAEFFRKEDEYNKLYGPGRGGRGGGGSGGRGGSDSSDSSGGSTGGAGDTIGGSGGARRSRDRIGGRASRTDRVGKSEYDYLYDDLK